MLAILTGTTCGFSCWHAEEDVCRCSCGGRNHGCLRNPDGKQPIRGAKIDGVRYELLAVGEYGDLAAESRKLLETPRKVITLGGAPYRLWWSDTEAGSPVRLKSATQAQVDKWPELQAYRGERRRPYLLWRRVDNVLPPPAHGSREGGPQSQFTFEESDALAAARS